MAAEAPSCAASARFCGRGATYENIDTAYKTPRYAPRGIAFLPCVCSYTALMTALGFIVAFLRLPCWVAVQMHMHRACECEFRFVCIGFWLLVRGALLPPLYGLDIRECY